MEKKNVLEEIGLSEGEIDVYLALLKLGKSPVSDLTKETGHHRTTIYDFLEHLLQKGLANYVIKSGVKYYKANKPEGLLEYIKEKEDKIKNILPDLKELSKKSNEEISVEVYKGREGFKTVFRDRLKVEEDLYGFGMEEKLFQEKFPVFLEQYFEREKEKGLHEYLLASEETEFTFEEDHMHYKYIPDKYFHPNAVVIYGNTVSITIWEPLTTIVIRNENLAESYRKHHKLLWNIAKEVKEKNSKK